MGKELIKPKWTAGTIIALMFLLFGVCTAIYLIWNLLLKGVMC